MSLDNVFSSLPSKSIVIVTICVTSVSFIVWQISKLRKGKNVSEPRKGKNVAKVASLFVYPIKSLQGLEVGTVEVTRNGMKYGVFRDRQMMLINQENRMITQRQESRLARIQVRMTGSTELTLNCDGYEPLKITPRTSKEPDEETIKFNVWSTATEGVEVDPEASRWFCNYLNLPGVKLVQHLQNFRMRPSNVASKNGGYLDHRFPILYQDGDPILLSSNDTLDQLNSTIDGIKMSQKNFRPNIVIEGCPPLSEENWNEITLNQIRMKNIKLCTRCSIPTIDIDTATKIDGREKVLKDFRSAKDELEKKNYGSNPLFGVNFLPMNEGFISVENQLDATFK